MAIRAMEITSYFTALAWPLAARAALWSGDGDVARPIVDSPAIGGISGGLFDADKAAARAGLAALEGRWSDSIAGYREAFRGYRAIGAVFAEALAAVDLAMLVPARERAATDLEEAISAARGTLARLGAAPFLSRLEEALANAEASNGSHRADARSEGSRDAVVSRLRA
jgi:hypothetical protein